MDLCRTVPLLLFYQFFGGLICKHEIMTARGVVPHMGVGTGNDIVEDLGICRHPVKLLWGIFRSRHDGS